jgi:hypothetical protein
MATPFGTWPPLPRNPQQVLGSNLAFWVQANLGLGPVQPGGAVTIWPDQVANGDAVQAPNPAAPVLRATALGLRPGVSFESAGAGLEAHLSTPFDAGDRPYMWCRGKLNQLIHTPGAAQLLFQLLTDPFIGGDAIDVDAEASGTFDGNSYWNLNGTNQETFFTLPPPTGDALLLGPHTIQAACQQSGALVVAGVSMDAPGVVAALNAAVNRFDINRAVVVPGNAGFWSIGALVFAYTQPSPAEIADVVAWANAYDNTPAFGFWPPPLLPAPIFGFWPTTPAP